MTPNKVAIFVPTFNERDNAPRLIEELLALGLDADLLFCDDNSPDGTGKLLDEIAGRTPRMKVLHRTGKLGIGSAHMDGIAHAYDQGYDTLVTMDCDFTHSPSDIPRLLEAGRDADVALGSRYLQRGSLPGWSPMRRFLTMFGHFLTSTFLGLGPDASGAFRVYNLRRIKRELFETVSSRSYAFFFESLFILVKNGCTIREIPIVLPARTYGHSKMSFREATRSANTLFAIWFENLLNPGRFRPARHVDIDTQLADPQNWDPYWKKKREFSGFAYEAIATVYRRAFIKRSLERALGRTFPSGSSLLHAGCGSGQVDQQLHRRYDITAIDISPQAVAFYARNNPAARDIRHASIFKLPFPDNSFDGAYNLGVIEHFLHDEIHDMLVELRRVIRPGGKLVVFWPHRHATSVLVLKVVHKLFRKFIDPNKAFHPPEPSLTRGRQEASRLMRAGGFDAVTYEFGARDLFVQAIVVAQKPAAAPASENKREAAMDDRSNQSAPARETSPAREVRAITPVDAPAFAATGRS